MEILRIALAKILILIKRVRGRIEFHVLLRLSKVLSINSVVIKCFFFTKSNGIICILNKGGFYGTGGLVAVKQ